jgi:hypothetical protein
MALSRDIFVHDILFYPPSANISNSVQCTRLGWSSHLGSLKKLKVRNEENALHCTPLHSPLRIYSNRIDLQRSGDIIARPTRMLQFWSEMQQTWHIHYPRHQEQL